MKKIFFATSLIMAALSISLMPQATMAGKTVVMPGFNGDPLSFKNDVIDLKEIPQGKPVTVEFEYTNNLDKAVILKNVQPTCGCTIADYDKAPILPGKSGKITATYNAAAMGAFTKTLIVSFGDDTQKSLTLKGTVI
jgi:hypothetical protein